MMLRIGCHLSSSRGYLAMGKQAVEIGANTFQFFTRNPRGGAVRPLDQADLSAYRAFADEHGLGPVLAHAPYTLNACAADERLRAFTRDAMREDLARLKLLPGSLYNFHPGSHVGQGADTGIRRIADLLNEVLAPGQGTVVLLETMEVGETDSSGGRSARSSRARVIWGLNGRRSMGNPLCRRASCRWSARAERAGFRSIPTQYRLPKWPKPPTVRENGPRQVSSMLLSCLCPLIIKLNGTAFLLADYASIFAFFLLGAVEIAIGLLISALTESQIIAAVGTFFILLMLYLWDGLVGYLPATAVGSLVGLFVLLIIICLLLNALSNNWTISLYTLLIGAAALIGFYIRNNALYKGLMAKVLGKFSPLAAFKSFANDHVFDISGALLYVSLIALLIFLTVQVLQKRRWN